MILDLIDQSDSQRLKFRCPNCASEGISTPAYALDGYFFDGSEKPGKWVRHKCADAPPPKKHKAPAS